MSQIPGPSPLVKKLLADIEIAKGKASMPEAKLIAWAKRLAKERPPLPVFCEIYTLGLELMKAGQNDLALAVSDLGAIGILPELAKKGAGKDQIGTRAQAAAAELVKKLEASPKSSPLASPRSKTGVGLRKR